MLLVYLIFPVIMFMGTMVCADEQSEICFSLSKRGVSLNNLCRYTITIQRFFYELIHH